MQEDSLWLSCLFAINHKKEKDKISKKNKLKYYETHRAWPNHTVSFMYVLLNILHRVFKMIFISLVCWLCVGKWLTISSWLLGNWMNEWVEYVESHNAYFEPWSWIYSRCFSKYIAAIVRWSLPSGEFSSPPSFWILSRPSVMWRSPRLWLAFEMERLSSSISHSSK